MDAIYVGIDVSKDRLDVHVRPSEEAFAVARNGKGLNELIERLRSLKPTLIAVEATGGFETIVAAAIAGEQNVMRGMPPVMGGEDFSYMLLARPGAYVFLGQGGGPGACFLHNPNYDFNDEVIPLGAGYLAALVEEALPLK